jgi:hypothetical protein
VHHFCIAGPIQSDIHYSIPPLGRLDHDQIMSLIEQRKYFVMRAPRQTGKTTALLALVTELNAAPSMQTSKPRRPRAMTSLRRCVPFFP